jgi:iron complex outermembrane recepter protein
VKPGEKMRTASLILSIISALGISHSTFAISVNEDIPLSTLLEMDISELMSIEVNVASRSTERLFNTPAAAYVITQEDIRRSGHRSIPELLRLVPGFHVGRIDANKWGISSRDAGNQFSKNMLILMDGRTLYSPLFNGIYWNLQDTLIEDIERIEIVRGPGGALWGANSISGVVNIVTKSATDTQDGLVYFGAGQGEMQAEAGFRQGFQIDDKTSARLYIKQRHIDHGEYLNSIESSNNNFFPVGTDAYDDGQYSQLGFRLDRSPDNKSELTLQGDIYDGKTRDIRKNSFNTIADTNDINVHGFNLLANWKYKFSDNQSFSSTTYLDVTDQQDDAFNDHREVFDFEVQHDILWSNQHTSWGFGARYHKDDTSNSNSNSTVTPRLNLTPPSKTDHLYHLFLQNKSEIIDNILFLTVGSKFEDNDYSGNEHQPSARLSYTPDEKHSLWLSASQSASTPTRGGQDLYLDFNDFFASCVASGFTLDPQLGCILDISTVDVATSVFTKELGYRGFFNKSHMIDIAIYHQTFNDSANHNTGLEIITRHEITNNWKLEYWFVQQRHYIDNAGIDSLNQSLQSPTMHLRSYWNITPSVQFDLLAYYTSEKKNVSGTNLAAESYERLDSHIYWKYNKHIEFNLAITNITNGVHAEELEDTSRINTGVKRGYFIKMDYTF